jgi:hypothetical protein
MDFKGNVLRLFGYTVPVLAIKDLAEPQKIVESNKDSKLHWQNYDNY